MSSGKQASLTPIHTKYIPMHSNFYASFEIRVLSYPIQIIEKYLPDI